MIATLAWQVCLLAFAACASEVLHLTEESFDDALQKHPVLLVQFYAPWCGHCKKLKPEYQKAAEALSGRAPLAAVDATKEVQLAEIYKVEGYPTLLFFRNGQPEEYLGGTDNETIVRWVIDHTGPALKVVPSEAALTKELAHRQTLPFVVARGSAALEAAATRVAEEQRNYAIFLFLQGQGAPDAVELHRGFKEVVRMDTPPTAAAGDEAVLQTADLMRRFVLEEMVPPFGEVDEHNFEGYLMRATSGMIWVCFAPASFRDDASQHAGCFETVAGNFPQFPVAYTDTKIYQDHVKEELGCVNFPTVVLQLGNFTDETANPRRFKLDLSATNKLEPEPISDWIRQALAGEVEEDEGLDELDAIDEEDAALYEDLEEDDEFEEGSAEQAGAGQGQAPPAKEDL